MKSNIKQFRIAFLLITIIVNTTIYGQTENKIKQTFVRVYNLNGNKISKGKVVAVLDSVLQLKRNDKLINIPVTDVVYIKTKRSAGNNILVGSIIGSVSGALIGAVSSNEETKTDSNWLFGEYEYTTGTSPGTGAIGGAGAGIMVGALVGAGVSVFKNSQNFVINGDKEKLKLFKEHIE